MAYKYSGGNLWLSIIFAGIIVTMLYVLGNIENGAFMTNSLFLLLFLIINLLVIYLRYKNKKQPEWKIPFGIPIKNNRGQKVSIPITSIISVISIIIFLYIIINNNLI